MALSGEMWLFISCGSQFSQEMRLLLWQPMHFLDNRVVLSQPILVRAPVSVNQKRESWTAEEPPYSYACLSSGWRAGSFNLLEDSHLMNV